MSLNETACPRVGSPASQRVDPIVMATHGCTGLIHLFLGSVAERVIRWHVLDGPFRAQRAQVLKDEAPGEGGDQRCDGYPFGPACLS